MHFVRYMLPMPSMLAIRTAPKASAFSEPAIVSTIALALFSIPSANCKSRKPGLASLEQRCVQAAFEFPDTAADRGVVDVELFTGARQVAGPRHLKEVEGF